MPVRQRPSDNSQRNQAGHLPGNCTEPAPAASRRHFLRMAGQAAALAGAYAVHPAAGFHLVQGARTTTSTNRPTFAYLGDAHLQLPARDPRPLERLVASIEAINALDVQPDFVVFGGDLAHQGDPEAMRLGAKALARLRSPTKMVVGEHDWYLDMGDLWRTLFGAANTSAMHQGTQVLTLMSVAQRDFWSSRNLTATERMQIVANMDDPRQAPFEVGDAQRHWLEETLAATPSHTPVMIFTHAPLYQLYRPWNFWTDDAPQLHALLRRFDAVTVVHGHVHQPMHHKIGNITFEAMPSTAFAYPPPPSTTEPQPENANVSLA